MPLPGATRERSCRHGLPGSTWDRPVISCVHADIHSLGLPDGAHRRRGARGPGAPPNRQILRISTRGRCGAFDEAFQAALAAIYQPRGRAPVPPARLAMVLVLQAYDQVGRPDQTGRVNLRAQLSRREAKARRVREFWPSCLVKSTDATPRKASRHKPRLLLLVKREVPSTCRQRGRYVYVFRPAWRRVIDHGVACRLVPDLHAHPIGRFVEEWWCG